MENTKNTAADKKLNPKDGLLSEDRKIELRKQAADKARELAVEEEEERFLEAEIRKAKAKESAARGQVTNEELIRHTVNLGPSAKQVKINGTIYLHGMTYELPKSVFNVIQETEFRTWMHEDSRQGASDNPYKLRGRTISGRGNFAAGVARA